MLIFSKQRQNLRKNFSIFSGFQFPRFFAEKFRFPISEIHLGRTHCVHPEQECVAFLLMLAVVRALLSFFKYFSLSPPIFPGIVLFLRLPASYIYTPTLSLRIPSAKSATIIFLAFAILPLPETEKQTTKTN